MKTLRLLFVAFVAMLGFVGCTNEQCNHDVVADDHSAEHSNDLVGTWTCLEENYAEALIIKADGTVVSTGVEDGEYWENVKGNIVVKDNNITMTFEDNDNYEGHFDIIPGVVFSIVSSKTGERYNYVYCTNDLADEIIGMWVCNETPSAEKNDMLIMTYNADGTTLFTGYSYEADVFSNNVEASYKVIGDLLIHKQPDIAVEYGLAQYNAMRIKYTPNGTALGDVKTLQAYAKVGEKYVETNTAWLRIKQSLDLAGKKYDYANLYLSNVTGMNKVFDFMEGYELNFANMDGSKLDMMLKSTLFNVEFPDKNTIKYSYQYGENKNFTEVPIVVEGNKLTVKMSTKGSALKDVVYYAFQDVDACQLHLYMHRNTVVDFYTNMQAFLTSWSQSNNDILDDTEAVKAIYDSFDEAIYTINMSIVLKAPQK